MRPTPSEIMFGLGLRPDPWQVAVLEGRHPRLLLNCCRQAGKSTTVALLALLEAMTEPATLVLLLSRSLRQSTELFRKVNDFHRRCRGLLKERSTAHELHFKNMSRIVSLPCQPDTVRGFSKVHMLVIDEAARVPDDLYRAVRPMLAVSRGRLICLSTPHGKRGFFYDAWTKGGSDWTRIEVPARDIPRITPAFLAEERRCLGSSFFRQEYECSFEALEGLVYPDFHRCVVPAPSWLAPLPWFRGGASEPTAGQAPPGISSDLCSSVLISGSSSLRFFGGLDFGFRNPFAAVWGVLDRDGVLWLTGEHYASEKPLSYHAQRLPRHVRWYADPSGATEIAELRLAGFKVSPGDNSLRAGIAAVASRIDNGTLKVIEGRCPNLVAEAALYRYEPADGRRKSENPVDDHNHALAALRYLVSKLDARALARMLRRETAAGPAAVPNSMQQSAPARQSQSRRWLRLSNPALWTPISRSDES